jgi:radical SAM protein with 4Fe4S-binding SPASM domain
MSPICDLTTGLDDKHYLEGFSRNIQSQRVPFSGSLALTHRCNLGCIHCYAKEGPLQHDISSAELSSGQWKKIISEIKEAGCLYLLLTGGEPLLREDFPEIYSFVKKNGFLVTVFTNGTLVSDRIAELFREFPPRLVEISLYGASAETHDRITGIPGSFERALQGIEKLIGQGIQVGLKSVLMTLNIDGFSAIGDLAQRYGVKFRLDAAIFPTLAGDIRPTDLRVSPEQAVALEMADPERAREWREYFAKFRIVPYGKKVFACSAGKTNFHVDPDGILFPCLIARSHKYSLKHGNFQEGWNGEIARIREEEVNDGYRCGVCEKKLICGFCPGFFGLEHGQNHVPSDYVCAMGKLRYEYITNGQVGG